MRLDTSQQLRLQQKLILAPRMIQSMEILQLPILELQERIQQELQENPVLEIKEKRNEEPSEPTPTEEAPPQDDYADEYDNWEADRELRTSRSRAALEEEGDRKLDAMQNMPDRPQSLQDHLLEQLAEIEVPAHLDPLVRYLISNLPNTGRFEKFGELIAAHQPPPTPEQVEEAIAIIHKMDPAGVGGRDLRETLLLQLSPELPHYDVLRVLISHHWDDVQHNRLPHIQKRTGFDLHQIKEALEVMKHLNPRPGSGFAGAQAPPVVPDLIVEQSENGEYTVRLVDDYIPDVRLSKQYLQFVKNRQGTAQERKFLRPRIQTAQWLIDAIQQRRQTLEKVTKAIIQHQKAFLDHGPEHITPLKMQQIADDVGVHVTTVSRAVDDKWVQTPRGTFALRRFFGGGTTTATGEEVAWELIKNKLLEIIAREDKANPWSDDALVEQLQAAGYPVARRTITKYRKLLRIPSSRQRKEWVEEGEKKCEVAHNPALAPESNPPAVLSRTQPGEA
jgi:RNA polymerase sigma-54 factor